MYWEGAVSVLQQYSGIQHVLPEAESENMHNYRYRVPFFSGCLWRLPDLLIHYFSMPPRAVSVSAERGVSDAEAAIRDVVLLLCKTRRGRCKLLETAA